MLTISGNRFGCLQLRPFSFLLGKCFSSLLEFGNFISSRINDNFASQTIDGDRFPVGRFLSDIVRTDNGWNFQRPCHNRTVRCLTFVVLGSLGGQLDAEPRRWFALGTVSASFLWFFGLALLAAWLAPRLRTASAQRVINLLVGGVMWFIAFQLAKEGVAHVQALFS